MVKLARLIKKCQHFHTQTNWGGAGFHPTLKQRSKFVTMFVTLLSNDAVLPSDML